MTDTNLEDFLNTPLGAVEKPAVQPPGTYLGTIVKHKLDKRRIGEEEIPFVEFQVKITNAEDDVDPELLAKVDMSNAFAYPRFDLNARGKYQLQNFLLGFFEEAGGGKMGEYLPMLVGKQVVFQVTNKPGKTKDGEDVLYVNYTNTKAA